MDAAAAGALSLFVRSGYADKNRDCPVLVHIIKTKGLITEMMPSVGSAVARPRADIHADLPFAPVGSWRIYRLRQREVAVRGLLTTNSVRIECMRDE